MWARPPVNKARGDGEETRKGQSVFTRFGAFLPSTSLYHPRTGDRGLLGGSWINLVNRPPTPDNNERGIGGIIGKRKKT